MTPEPRRTVKFESDAVAKMGTWASVHTPADTAEIIPELSRGTTAYRIAKRMCVLAVVFRPGLGYHHATLCGCFWLAWGHDLLAARGSSLPDRWSVQATLWLVARLTVWLPWAWREEIAGSSCA